LTPEQPGLKRDHEPGYVLLEVRATDAGS
jgi:hypothetical protein